MFIKKRKWEVTITNKKTLEIMSTIIFNSRKDVKNHVMNTTKLIAKAMGVFDEYGDKKITSSMIIAQKELGDPLSIKIRMRL